LCREDVPELADCDMARFLEVDWLQSLFSQVCRGTAVTLVSPTAGTEELAQNPFKEAEAAS
jgi:hypothetical protein